eukprot:Skav219544  [mRNA]  locus=scaffold1863:29000:29917:+ [translate_table: standard]
MFRSSKVCPRFQRFLSVRGISSQTLQLSQRYQLDGFCFPLELFPEKRHFCREFVPRYEAFRHACLKQKKWSEYRFKSHLLLPWLHDMLVKNDRLKEVACGLLATDDVVIWSTDWCVKPRSSDDHFTWHQDSTYSNFGEEGATVWLAFSHVRTTSGPLLFRRSSHLLGQLPHKESEDESNLLAFGQYIPEVQEQGRRHDSKWTLMETVSAELEPGQASAHSFLTIHRSSSNSDSADRIGLAVRIVRASAGLGRADRATPLCGSAQSFEIEAAPEIEFGKRELREWELSMEREKAMYFANHVQSHYK